MSEITSQTAPVKSRILYKRGYGDISEATILEWSSGGNVKFKYPSGYESWIDKSDLQYYRLIELLQ